MVILRKAKALSTELGAPPYNQPGESPGNMAPRKGNEMAQAFIGPTEIIIAGAFSQQHNEHCKGWRWHAYISDINKNYLADISARQAAKRAAGIGPEGRCHA